MEVLNNYQKMNGINQQVSHHQRGEKANTLRYLLPDWLFDYNSDGRSSLFLLLNITELVVEFGYTIPKK